MGSEYYESEACDQCGVPWIVISDPYSLFCQYCGQTIELDADDFMAHQETLSKPVAASQAQFSNLRKFFDEHNKNASGDMLQLPTAIVDTAITLFTETRAHEGTKETRNTKRKKYIAACTWKACQMRGQMRKKEDIQTLLGLKGRKIGTALTELEIRLNLTDSLSDVSLVDSRDVLVGTNCDKLGIREGLAVLISSDMKYITHVVAGSLQQITNSSDIVNVAALFVALRINGVQISKSDLAYINGTKRVSIMSKIINVICDNAPLFTLFNDRVKDS